MKQNYFPVDYKLFESFEEGSESTIYRLTETTCAKVFKEDPTGEKARKEYKDMNRLFKIRSPVARPLGVSMLRIPNEPKDVYGFIMEFIPGENASEIVGKPKLRRKLEKRIDEIVENCMKQGIKIVDWGLHNAIYSEDDSLTIVDAALA